MTDFAARSAGQFQGQPWVLAIPQPWDQQPYSPYEHRKRFDPDISIDPGIYANPQPGWSGDPGIFADPPQAWGGDPGIVAQPFPRTATVEDTAEAAPVDAVAALGVGDHVKHGATSLIVPGLAGGILAGALSSAAAPVGLKGAAFTGRMVGSTIGSVATGAAMGLAVAASSPTDEDSLAARYAVAGGTLGLVGGALAPSRVRGLSMVVGTAGNAALGWFVGRSLETKAKADAAAAAANMQLEPGTAPTFPTVAA